MAVPRVGVILSHFQLECVGILADCWQRNIVLCPPLLWSIPGWQYELNFLSTWAWRAWHEVVLGKRKHWHLSPGLALVPLTPSICHPWQCRQDKPYNLRRDMVALHPLKQSRRWQSVACAAATLLPVLNFSWEVELREVMLMLMLTNGYCIGTLYGWPWEWISNLLSILSLSAPKWIATGWSGDKDPPHKVARKRTFWGIWMVISWPGNFLNPQNFKFRISMSFWFQKYKNFLTTPPGEVPSPTGGVVIKIFRSAFLGHPEL